MNPQTKHATANFIAHLYKDDPKSANYLDKKRCELRSYIKKGETSKPLYIKYQEWQATQQEPTPTPTPKPPTPAPSPLAPPTPPAPTQPTPDVERMKKQIRAMNSKLNDADEQIGDLQDKLAHANEKLDEILQDYKEVCEERNRLQLKLEGQGMTKETLAQFERYKEVYRNCRCQASKYACLSSPK